MWRQVTQEPSPRRRASWRRSAPSRGFNRQASAPAATPTYRLSLAIFLAGQFVSGTGTRINAVALPLLVIDRYGIGLSLGLVTATRLVPRVLLGPLAGALVDRLPRRATLIATNLASAALVALVPLTGALWQLYLLAALVGLVETLMRPAGFAILPEVFPEEALYRVNAAQELVDAATNLAGPTAAVALVTAFGLAGAFGADALWRDLLAGNGLPTGSIEE